MDYCLANSNIFLYILIFGPYKQVDLASFVGSLAMMEVEDILTVEVISTVTNEQVIFTYYIYIY